MACCLIRLPVSLSVRPPALTHSLPTNGIANAYHCCIGAFVCLLLGGPSWRAGLASGLVRPRRAGARFERAAGHEKHDSSLWICVNSKSFSIRLPTLETPTCVHGLSISTFAVACDETYHLISTTTAAGVVIVRSYHRPVLNTVTSSTHSSFPLPRPTWMLTTCLPGPWSALDIN